MIACSSSVSITSMLYAYIQVLLFLSSLSKATSHNHRQLLTAFLSVIRVHLVWYTLATSLTIAAQLLVYVYVCAYTRFACSVHVLYLTLYLLYSVLCTVVVIIHSSMCLVVQLLVLVSQQTCSIQFLHVVWHLYTRRLRTPM